ncbi:hypothetical protein [Lentzea sp. NPDC060358]|uniref:hypothetical protein n=1 Tax=Lentzea sp. NPDC060358 TaxID=3347103 RepID=UPI0036691A53
MAFLEAVVSGRLGRYEESRTRFEACARAHAELGDVPAQVRCLGGVVWSLVMLGRQGESLEVAETAYELQRGDAGATGERVGEALYRVVQALLFLGRHEEALARCAELDSLTSETTSPYELGRRAATKGVVFLRIGEFDRAVATLTDSVGWLEQAGTWSDVASAQKWLGEALERAGDVAGARRRWTEALATFEHHQHPFADQVRAQLAALPGN